MICYSLHCDQGHQFEGWFSSSDDYEKQYKSALLECPICGSKHIEKSLMAPNVVAKRETNKNAKAAYETDEHSLNLEPTTSKNIKGIKALVPADKADAPQAIEQQEKDIAKKEAVLKLARAYRKAVTKEADFVGPKFSEEARKMHYGEVKKRAIWGEVKKEEVPELLEEGITLAPIPLLPEDLN